MITIFLSPPFLSTGIGNYWAAIETIISTAEGNWMDVVVPLPSLDRSDLWNPLCSSSTKNMHKSSSHRRSWRLLNHNLFEGISYNLSYTEYWVCPKNVEDKWSNLLAGWSPVAGFEACDLKVKICSFNGWTRTTMGDFAFFVRARISCCASRSSAGHYICMINQMSINSWLNTDVISIVFMKSGQLLWLLSLFSDAGVSVVFVGLLHCSPQSEIRTNSLRKCSLWQDSSFTSFCAHARWRHTARRRTTSTTTVRSTHHGASQPVSQLPYRMASGS